MKAFACLALMLAIAGPVHAQSAADQPLPTISNFQPQRYLGTWHEVAKLPNRFQKMCMANTRALYEALGDAIKVTNRCEGAEGKTQEAIGEARFIDKANGKLEVRFAPAWLSWLPFVWGRYWILDLDEGYQTVLVGEPSREFLWILSRNPQMSTERYEALVKKAASLGFDAGKIERSVNR
jgi:apolipoprotein D and lipocalin family protein